MLPSSLSSSLVLSSVLLVAACGGSTADPPGSGAPPGATATSTASASPPPNPGAPAAPSFPPPAMPTATATATATSVPTPPPPPQPNACNALVNVGSLVTAFQVAADAPAATGGIVADGTYHLTDLTIFTGAGGNSGALPVQLKQTVAIHGGTADAITEVNGKSQAQSTTFVTTGTSATTAGTCPTAEPPQTGEYSATPTSLVLYLPNDQGKTTRYTYVP